MDEATPAPHHDAIGVLIMRAHEGDGEAWRQLHERFRALVALVAEASMPDHLRGRFDPEDVVQSAFISAFEALPRYEYRGERAFISWLRGIARNEMISRVRLHDSGKRSPAREVSGENQDAIVDHWEDTESPSQVVMRRQNRTMVLQAMLCLSEEAQELLWMRNFEERTWEAIAETLELPVGQVRRRYERAVEALIRLLP